MLRIAIMRGRRSDWLLFWLSLAIVVGCLAVIGEYSTEGETPGEEPPPKPADYVCLVALLGLALGVPTHYLVADIRHYQDPRPAAGRPPLLPAGSPYGPATPAGGPYGMPQQPPGYGYLPAQSPTPAHVPPVHPSTHVPPVQPPSHAGPTRPQAPSHVMPVQPPAQPIPAPAPLTRPAAAPATGRIDQVRAELDELSDLLRKEKEEGK